MCITDFKTSNYFTGMPYVLGFILAPAGLLLLLSAKYVIGVAVILWGVAILTTHYRISINFTEKKCTEYISVLRIKTARETFEFSTIEYLYLKKIKVSQNLNSRASSTTISKEQYEGYLRFSDQLKVNLMTLDSKNALVKKLREIGEQLNVEVFDSTGETPVKL